VTSKKNLPTISFSRPRLLSTIQPRVFTVSHVQGLTHKLILKLLQIQLTTIKQKTAEKPG